VLVNGQALPAGVYSVFTVPGERVNRPDFGCGLLQLVFAPNSVELAATLQVLVQGALQQWLGDLLRIDEVQVDSVDATLSVQVRYTALNTQASRIASSDLPAPVTTKSRTAPATLSESMLTPPTVRASG